MRVDELVSGIRSDVAVKLFGEDMTILEEKAAQIEKIMETVRGQTDLNSKSWKAAGRWSSFPTETKWLAME